MRRVQGGNCRAQAVPARVIALWLGLCLIPAAHAQFGTPVDIGSATAFTAGPNPQHINTTQAVPAGGSIIVIAYSRGDTPPTGATCSDGYGHAYNIDVSQGTGTSLSIICSTHAIAAQFDAGVILTVTWTGGSGPQEELLHAFSVTGLVSTPLDRTASASGTSASPSSGATLTTSQANELLFAAIVDEDTGINGTAGFVPGTNGTSNNCAVTGTPTYSSLAAVSFGGIPSFLLSMYCQVSATGAYLGQGTLYGNPSWDALLATYELCPAGDYCAAGSTSPASCPAGDYCPAGSTSPTSCPAGDYCPAGSSSPTLCPEGSYNPNTGSSDSSACQSCPEGNYCPALGTSSPTTCPSGAYCPTGSAHPTPCLAGSYNPNSGSSSSSACLTCPAGYACPAGASTDTPCPAGTYSSHTNLTTTANCSACPAGDYCPAASSSPTTCPAGDYCLAHAGSPTTCIAGYYCPAGTSSPPTCPAGDYCPAGSSSPTTCTAGNYCPPGSSSPTACTAGDYCPAGSAAPTACPAGTYNSNTGSSSSSACQSCPPGDYCPAGSSSPTTCTAGNYCPPGSTAPTTCPAGDYCAAGSSSPTTCPAGNYCPAGSTAPTTCPADDYCPAGSSSPNTCPPGDYCAAGSSSPTTCPAGDYCPAGSTAPTTCPAGDYCPAGSAAPTACPAGTYNASTGSASSSVCLTCPAGDYCLAGSSFPTTCPVGGYCPAGASAPLPVTFAVKYAANLQFGESYINLINDGANGAPLNGPGIGGTTGNICVNVYAFDANEEMISCCSCLVTPDQVMNLGVNRDIASNTATGVVPTSVTIKVLATLAGSGGSGTSCTNSAAGVATGALADGLEALGTTLHAQTQGFGTTEAPFVNATLSTTELNSLGNRCTNIVGNLSGFGICASCRKGALGAAGM